MQLPLRVEPERARGPREADRVGVQDPAAHPDEPSLGLQRDLDPLARGELQLPQVLQGETEGEAERRRGGESGAERQIPADEQLAARELRTAAQQGTYDPLDVVTPVT